MNEIGTVTDRISLPDQKIDLSKIIYSIRGKLVMLDSDLALLYGYEVKRLNEQVKNNINRFPEDFMFQMTKEEVKYLRSKFSTATINPKSRSYPHVFTLNILAKKCCGVNVIVYTLPSTKISVQDIANFNAQYPTLTVKKTTAFHDRFLIIDGIEGYHIGASIKDAGKKCFGINRIEDIDVINNLLKKAVQTSD